MPYKRLILRRPVYAWLNLNLRYFPFPRVHGGRSSTVEPRIVVPAVAGSNPVGHPSKKGASSGDPKRRRNIRIAFGVARAAHRRHRAKLLQNTHYSQKLI